MTNTYQTITTQPIWDLIRCLRVNPQQVGAIHAGAKTMIRQPLKPQPADDYCMMTQAGLLTSANPIEVRDGLIHAKLGSVITWANLPYHVGDLLYVPETWRAESPSVDDPMRYAIRIRQPGEEDAIVEFTFSDPERAETWAKYRDRPETEWLSPYFMPREASRIFLRVARVGVSRLQDISKEDAISEGVLWSPDGVSPDADPMALYETLWGQKRRSKDGPESMWAQNPWVWVLQIDLISRDDAIAATNTLRKRLEG